MNRFHVRFLAYLICFALFLPTSIAKAGPSNTLPSQTESPQTVQLLDEDVFLPLIMNGSICTKAPTLLEPANGSILNNLIPLLKWDDGNDPNATLIHLQVARDADFGRIVLSLTGGGSGGIFEYRPTENFDPSATLFWRAYLMCGTTQSPYSETWSFLTGYGGTVLPAPSLIAPADDTAIPSLAANLHWSAINGAVEYLIRINPTGQGGYTYATTTNTDFTTWSLTPNTTYDWWITARNAYAWGQDSVKWQFTTPAGTQSNSQGSIFFVEQDADVFTIIE